MQPVLECAPGLGLRAGEDGLQVLRPGCRTALVAVGASLAAAGVWHICSSSFGNHAPLLILHVAAVALVTQYRGMAAGGISTAASFGLILYQLDPIPDAVTVTLFNVLGVALSVFGGRRWRAEHALARAHERLALKHEAARIGTFEWFVREGRVELSPEMERLYGIGTAGNRHTFEEWKTFVHPEDLPHTLTAMQTCIDQRQPAFDATYRIVRRDGTIAWIHSRCRFQYEASGEPGHISGVSMDVTELKRTEEELKRSSRMVSQALEAGRSGAWAWDAQTGELSWTSSYYHLLGLDPRQKPSPDLFFSLVDHRDLRALQQSLADALEGRVKDFRTEFRVNRADGVRWLERRGHAFCNSEGKVVKILGITTDVTERKILRGLLHTCAQCKKIRDEHGRWNSLEAYITEHSEALLSHGLCPDCYRRFMQEADLPMPVS